MIYYPPLISVLFVSLVSMIGAVTLVLGSNRIKKYSLLLVSLSVGALLGNAFLHLIPESMEVLGETTPLLVIVGILLFFILEKVIHWHHHEDCEHEHPVGKLILLSDGLHNFVDGLIIGASYLLSTEVGIATTIAVIIHEIPQEIGDFAILLQAGYSKSKALFYNFISALASVLGLTFIFLFEDVSESLETALLAIAAGGFIYIAMSDLLPELHKTKKIVSSAMQFIFIIIGITLIAIV